MFVVYVCFVWTLFYKVVSQFIFFANLCYYVNSKLAELHAKEHITDIRG